MPARSRSSSPRRKYEGREHDPTRSDVHSSRPDKRTSRTDDHNDYRERDGDSRGKRDRSRSRDGERKDKK